MIILPKERTFSRWYKLTNKPFSLLRALEYEAIEGIILEGNTLDIGGGSHVDYHNLLTIKGKIDTVNIDSEREPTYLLDINNSLPLANNSFDHIVSLNTFEHIKNDVFAISEALRVLKVGGTFHFIVPFCYKVHGSPSDYHRHTAYWWEQYLTELGIVEYTIEPLVWDPRSSAYALLGRKIDLTQRFLMLLALIDVKGVARHFKYNLGTIQNKLFKEKSSLMTINERNLIVNNWVANFALGYYIRGKK